MSDRLLGGIMMLVALAFVVGATQIEAGMIFDPLGARMFPIIIGVILGISALFPLLKPDPEPEWPTRRIAGQIVLVLLIMVAYAYTLVPLGFVLSTALASALLSWRLGAKPLFALPVGIGIAVGIYVVFNRLLGLSLAAGPWGF